MRWLRLILLGVALGGCSSGGDDEGAPPDGDAGPGGDDAPVEASALFVLGDSLSDTGNAAGMADFLLGEDVRPPTVGFCNPADVLTTPRPCDDLFYRQSRVSDGPVAVEVLAAGLDLGELVPSLHLVPNAPVSGTNYAIASAKARGADPEDLERQVDALLAEHAALPEDALYVVMIGGNDAIDALQARVEDADPEASAAIVSAAVSAIGDNVERLLDFGARRLVVANVPDLATLPAVLTQAAAAADAPAVLDAARAVSASLNSQLRARLDEIEASDRWQTPTPPVLVRFALLAALEAAREAAAAQGDNTVDACFDSEAYRDSSTAERVFHPECAPEGGGAPRFDAFVFWDGIHPTGSTHAAIGAALLEAL